MKKALFSTTILIVLFFSSFSRNNPDELQKLLIGNWNYELSEAPYGYEKGIISFLEKNEKLTCLVKLEAGTLAADSLKIEDEKIILFVTIDNNSIKVILKLVDNKLTGTVDTPEGEKKLTANKITVE